MRTQSHEPRARAAWIAPLVVAAITFAAFLPALRAGFVAWDDQQNFIDNPYYRGLRWTNLHWMWTTFHLGHWVPLTWMTLGLDYVLWGMNPAGYHLTNLLLHTADAVLLYFVAKRLLVLAFEAQPRDPPPATVLFAAALAALIWSIHPLRVESVVWITERRDVLSEFFYLASVLAYLRATESGDARRRWYWLAVAAFVCALLSKATSVSLPAVLLILNIYPLRRLGGRAGWWTADSRRVYLEVVPFAVLSAATGVLSIVALRPPDQLSAGGKIAVSAYSLCFYLWKWVLPVRLSPLYDMPKTVDPLAANFVASYVAAVALTTVAWRLRGRWPGLTTAWLAFLVIILPMLGVVQNGPQIAADRYTYHAMPALAILVAGAVTRVRRPLSLASALSAIVVLALGARTWDQIGVWHDSESLWTHVLSLNDESSIAQTALANILVKQDRVEEAIEHYRRSIELDPKSQEAENNLGIALAREGKVDEAIAHFRRQLEIKPDHYEAHNNLGVALARQGDLEHAIEQYRAALAIKPDYADAQTNWGNALVRESKLEEAIGHYQEVVRLRPDNADAHLNWGVALARLGRLGEAIEQFQRVLAIDPTNADAKAYLERAAQLQRAKAQLQR